MKSRDSAVRMKRFEAAERARKVADLETMVRDFETMILDLDRQIASEEERTGVRDRAHFAYSTFAQAAVQRRDNLTTSVSDLKAQLDVARRIHDDVQEELRRLEADELRESSTLDRGRIRGDRSGVSAG
jgi:flagellar protein FliJ